jgi:hypothetical protein
MAAGIARAVVLSVLLVAMTIATVACDSYHVTLKAGDCVNASLVAVGCGDPAASLRVVDVVRKTGGNPSCAPNLSIATFQEGGDGPMIGVAVCMGPLAGAVPS